MKLDNGGNYWDLYELNWKNGIRQFQLTVEPSLEAAQ